jgi:DNA-binding HxlR family transcriptional regulator
VPRTSFAEHPCSIARTLEVVGEWWTPLIVRDVAYGVRRFSELQEGLGIAANVLAQRLEALVSEGILETRVYRERPRRSEYVLTEKGLDLVPALIALMQWGDRWKWGSGAGPVRVVHAQCGHEARVQVRCDRCERELASSELRALPGAPLEQPPRHGEPGSVSGARLHAHAGGIPLH